MTHNPNVYGYVNGKPVFSRDEFIFEHRKRGPTPARPRSWPI